MDDDGLHVGDDQDWRVFQREGVALELGEGRGQVFILALVFPGEAFAFPDVCPAFATTCLLGALFEGVPGAVGIGFGGRWFAEEPAEVVEMGLGTLALSEIGWPPFVYEFFCGHCDLLGSSIGAVRRKLPLVLGDALLEGVAAVFGFGGVWL